MAGLLRIRDWHAHFENNRSREVKYPQWVPIPNDLSSYGLREIATEPDAAEIFGAFILMVELASRCKPRGELHRGNGKHYDAGSLARKTGFPKRSFDRAIEVCSRIGWIELVGGATISQDPATISQEGATSCRRKGREEKGREEKGTELECGEKQRSEAAPVKGKPKRKSDQVWDVVVDLWYPDGVPDKQRTAVGGIVKQFKQLGADAAEIRRRYRRARADWGTRATARAVLNNWGQFRDPDALDLDVVARAKADAAEAKRLVNERRIAQAQQKPSATRRSGPDGGEGRQKPAGVP